MKIHRGTLVAIAVTLMGLTAGCKTVTAKPAADNIRVLAGGFSSGVKHQEYHDLHTVAAFRDWWQRAYATQNTVPALPQVDFSKEMVIAVFMGEKSHGGYSLQVSGVQATTTAYDVEITVNLPGADCHTTQVLTQPFEFVAVPGSDGKFVNWKVQQHYQNCKS